MPISFLPASLIWSEKYYSQLSKIGSENFFLMSGENHLPTQYSSTVSFKNIFEILLKYLIFAGDKEFLEEWNCCGSASV